MSPSKLPAEISFIIQAPFSMPALPTLARNVSTEIKISGKFFNTKLMLILLIHFENHSPCWI